MDFQVQTMATLTSMTYLLKQMDMKLHHHDAMLNAAMKAIQDENEFLKSCYQTNQQTTEELKTVVKELSVTREELSLTKEAFATMKEAFITLKEEVAILKCSNINLIAQKQAMDNFHCQ